jgi:hypothetical protein
MELLLTSNVAKTAKTFNNGITHLKKKWMELKMTEKL